MPVAAWREVMVEPGAIRHLVLVHQTDAYLEGCVATWAARALTTGGGAILVGRPAHLAAILARIRILGVDVSDRLASGRLLTLEATTVMSGCFTDGKPDEAKFREVVGAAIDGVRKACGSPDADIRAWGEMVDILHEQGRPVAARELEAMWDAFLEGDRARLLCTYRTGRVVELADACETHGALVVENGGDMELVTARLLQELFAGTSRAPSLELLLQHGGVAIGGPPPTAYLFPLDRWTRPHRVAPR